MARGSLPGYVNLRDREIWEEGAKSGNSIPPSLFLFQLLADGLANGWCYVVL